MRRNHTQKSRSLALASFVAATAFAAGAQAAPDPNLRGLYDFAVLAATMVIADGQDTVIEGHLGLSPGDEIAGELDVVFAVHSQDFQAEDAQSDLELAVRDIQNRPVDEVLDANLGGLVVHAGVYEIDDGANISGASLTLDAAGDPSSVFIFRTTGDLRIEEGLQIDLMNGADPSHIYWQVDQKAEVGVGSVFNGSLLVGQDIDLAEGARINGRALSGAGSVHFGGDNRVVRTGADDPPAFEDRANDPVAGPGVITGDFDHVSFQCSAAPGAGGSTLPAAVLVGFASVGLLRRRRK